MKLCKNCKFAENKAVNLGQGQMQMMFVCMHPETVHLVNGEAVLCEIARTHATAGLCGAEGKYYEIKEEKPIESKVIQL